MKFTITGSLGHISKPLTQQLLQQGHAVTVISSNPEKQRDIEALGAIAAIGSIENVDFLASAFKGADAVYCMEPPPNFFDQRFDYMAYAQKLAHGFATAIRQSGVQRVVHLSSIGAHTDKGNGMLAFHYHVEKILSELPAAVAITFLRPVGFYYNMLGFIHSIKTQGAIVSNYGDLTEPWVSPLDIATVAAAEIVQPFEGRQIRYVASDEVNCNDVAAILGEAIGKPDLAWITIPDEQLLNNLTAAGINPGIAKGLVDMNAGRRTGVLYEDYYLNKPTLGKVKMKDFAKDFAAVYNQQ